MISRSVIHGRLAITALLTLIVGSSFATGQQPGPTFVAVVREDGSMIPIAAFDGGQWWNRWPPSDDGDLPRLPAGLSLIPPEWLPPGTHIPVNWRMQTPNGRQRAIKVLRPIRTFMLDPMQHVLGLQSDSRWKAEPGEVDGALAVSGPGTIGRFLKSSRPESDAITKQLDQRLQALEQQAIATWLEETERPIDTAKQLRRVYRNGDSPAPEPFALNRAERSFKGQTFYHLTGEKLYAGFDVTNSGCKMNLSFDGVVATDRTGTVVFENLTAFGYAEFCGDRPESTDFIGTLEVGDQLLWIGINHLEDGFDYFLKAPGSRDPLSLRR